MLMKKKSGARPNAGFTCIPFKAEWYHKQVPSHVLFVGKLMGISVILRHKFFPFFVLRTQND